MPIIKQSMATRIITGSLPGPAPKRVLGWRGNLLAFRRDPLGYLASTQRTCGPIATIAQGSARYIFVLGADPNRMLLSEAELASSCVDRAQVIAPCAAHADPYDSRLPESLHAAVVDGTERMLDRWAVSQPVDVAYVMRQLVMHTALTAILGMEDESERTILGKLLYRWGESALPPLRFGLAPHFRPQRAEQLERFVLARFAAYQPLHPALEAIDGRDLAANLVAGAACAASGLTWTLLLLSQHLRVLDDLQAELQAQVHGDPPTLDHLCCGDTSLPLLERVILESLRLLPPISLGARMISEARSLGAYQATPGSIVVYSPFLTHRQPERFFGPLKFRPERWLYLDPAPHEYLPFGAESYTRLSAPWAILQIKVILAMLLQRFHLALAPGVRINRAVGLTLMPRDGMPMIITPADRSLMWSVRGNIREMIALA